MKNFKTAFLEAETSLLFDSKLIIQSIVKKL